MGELKKTDQLSGFDRRIKKSGLFDALTGKPSDTNSILLLDTSSSMSDVVEGSRLIEHLKVAVEEYVGEYTMVEFNSKTQVVNELSSLHASGCTGLLKGLELCQSLGASHVMLVSDGEPDYGSREESIEYCMVNKIKVSSMFIGNSTKGLEFMKQISEQTGGVHTGNVDKGVGGQLEGFGGRLIRGVRGLIECNEKVGGGNKP